MRTILGDFMTFIYSLYAIHLLIFMTFIYSSYDFYLLIFMIIICLLIFWGVFFSDYLLLSYFSLSQAFKFVHSAGLTALQHKVGRNRTILFETEGKTKVDNNPFPLLINV